MIVQVSFGNMLGWILVLICCLPARIVGTPLYYVHYCRKDTQKANLVRWAAESLADYHEKVRGVRPLVILRPVLYQYVPSTVFTGDVTFIVASRRNKLKPSCVHESSPLWSWFSELAQHPRVYNIAEAGEVFGGDYRCNGMDIVLDRSLSRPVHGNCRKIHYLQGAGFQGREEDNYDLHELCRRQRRSAPKGKVFLSTTRVMKRHYHYTDALFRVALFQRLAVALLDVHGTGFTKRLDGLEDHFTQCGGNDLAARFCKKGYRFSIDMENTREMGYISEKIFTGLMGHTIPVYFGSPSIGDYVNIDRIIHCDVPESLLATARLEIDTSLQITNTELVDKFAGLAEPWLQQCVDKVVMVENNATLLESKLTAPVFSPSICRQNPINFNVGADLFKEIYI